MRQAAPNSSGPISPGSNGAANMPSGRLRQQPCQIALPHRQWERPQILAAKRQDAKA